MPGICYFQITTDSPEKAKNFYEKLFGWNIEKTDAPYDYWEFDTPTSPENSKKMQGGLVKLDKSMCGKVGGILVYFDVDDIDSYIAKVKELGGTIIVDKMAVPAQGYMSICADDQGASFGLWQPDTQAQPTAEQKKQHHQAC